MHSVMIVDNDIAHVFDLAAQYLFPEFLPEVGIV